MYFRVIGWEAIRDHPEKVKDLIRSNNADQGFAMGQHLIGLKSKMHEYCCAAPPPTPGESIWDTVREEALAEAETQWAETDLMSCYNLAMSLDKIRFATLVDFPLYCTNPTVTTVEPAFLARVAGMEAKYGWDRVALIARQLMSDPEKEYEQLGGSSSQWASRTRTSKLCSKQRARLCSTWWRVSFQWAQLRQAAMLLGLATRIPSLNMIPQKKKMEENTNQRRLLPKSAAVWPTARLFSKSKSGAAVLLLRMKSA